MIFTNPKALQRRITELSRREVRRRVEIFEDTSEFMSIDAGSVLRLSGNDYLVLGIPREGRFGIDDQPKFWVKSTLDLTSGEKKIIKLVFREMFTSRIGETLFHCARSPEKESAVLRRMRGHPNFMQGRAVRDAAGNEVRIIDFIPGPSLYDYLRKHRMRHEEYYRRMLPEIMPRVIDCFAGISRLHKEGLHHGDIRADHLLVEGRNGAYAWIDFDLEVDNASYDVVCLGNVLQQVVGKGRHSLMDIQLQSSDYPDFTETLVSGDMSLMYPHRIMNLRKLYPYISGALNEILMRFSVRAADAYSSVDGLLEDLRSLPSPPAVLAH